ncbi:hypothetical protein LWF01_15130 [Saxibacter everestensis]|uniref:Uncharacterized protein n=1 Tax=Saxibacter everestensis TaxID=2909229 RepID=A0ABY8QSY4_9MICO|nr:hypothetical protein LWF01_15130 [Brevibacteriaceae bacterium ZFBP1038]
MNTQPAGPHDASVARAAVEPAINIDPDLWLPPRRERVSRVGRLAALATGIRRLFGAARR